MLMGFKTPRGPEALTIALVAGQLIGLIRTSLVAGQLGTEVQGEAVTIGLLTGFFSTLLVLNTAWQPCKAWRKAAKVCLLAMSSITLVRSSGSKGWVLYLSLMIPVHRCIAPQAPW